MEEDRLDQRDHVSAGVVTGTNARHMDELRREEEERIISTTRDQPCRITQYV